MKKRKQIHCPYCGAKATLLPSSAVYGDAAKTDGYLYVCDRYPKCDSYVGAHKKPNCPWGLLQTGAFAISVFRRTKHLTGCGNPDS